MPDLKPDTFENSFAHSEVAGMWYNTSPKNLTIKVNFVPYEVCNQNINTYPQNWANVDTWAQNESNFLYILTFYTFSFVMFLLLYFHHVCSFLQKLVNVEIFYLLLLLAYLYSTKEFVEWLLIFAPIIMPSCSM